MATKIQAAPQTPPEVMLTESRAWLTPGCDAPTLNVDTHSSPTTIYFYDLPDGVTIAVERVLLNCGCPLSMAHTCCGEPVLITAAHPKLELFEPGRFRLFATEDSEYPVRYAVYVERVDMSVPRAQLEATHSCCACKCEEAT